MRIGLDPEVAIVSKKTGKGRSAHMFLGDGVRQFEFRDDRGLDSQMGSEVERDGAAIEVRSIVPSACRDNIIPYVAEALRQTHLDLAKWRKGHFKLASVPVYTLDAKSLENPPEDVLEFGCRPDLDAYALEVKDPQCPPGEKRRFTGGHIHWSTVHAARDIEQQAALAILFDCFVALPMVAILGEKFADGEAERRQFYGQPGSFRYDDKLDKIEFRTLSGRVLLHPTLLYWALGSMKTLYNVRYEGVGWKDMLLKYIIPTFSPEVIHETIMNHDVTNAERISQQIFKLLPTYRENERDLSNPLNGGGGGTNNPYFYEQAVQVFIAGNREGVAWDDDMVHNWGLYEDYEPKHHAYWGIQQAMVGLCDDSIFPYNAVLPKVWPKDLIQKTPIYTHPLNGGAKEYVKPSAAGWLR